MLWTRFVHPKSGKKKPEKIRKIEKIRFYFVFLIVMAGFLIFLINPQPQADIDSPYNYSTFSGTDEKNLPYTEKDNTKLAPDFGLSVDPESFPVSIKSHLKVGDGK